MDSFTHDAFVTSCIDLWEIIGSLSSTELSNVDTFYYKIFLNHSLISTTSSEKSLSAGKLSNSQWQINILQNSSFHLKAQILSLTNTVSCLQLLEVAVSVHF